jgi:hypothetical protein
VVAKSRAGTLNARGVFATFLQQARRLMAAGLPATEARSADVLILFVGFQVNKVRLTTVPDLLKGGRSLFLEDHFLSLMVQGRFLRANAQKAKAVRLVSTSAGCDVTGA